MGLLVNFAVLFSTLGVLQVSSYDTKDVQLGKIGYEPECFKKTSMLTEYNPRYMSFLKVHLSFKDECIQFLQEVVTAANQCCGKESEEKKCILETILPPMQKYINTYRTYETEYRGFITQTLSNMSRLAIFSEDEIDCCCGGKIDSCVKKLEFSTATYKQTVKECKRDPCAYTLNKFLSRLPEYLDSFYTTYALEEEIIKEWENIQKMKEDVPKDGKCKDEKSLVPLKQAVRTLSLRLNYFIPMQMRLNWNLNVPMLEYAVGAIKETLDCGGETCY